MKNKPVADKAPAPDISPATAQALLELGGMDVMDFTGWEIDAAICEAFPGLPDREYSTDANACRLMEAEIERRGLGAAYVYCLAGLVLDANLLPRHLWVWDNAKVFAAMTAFLDMKCRAALLAVMETEGNNHAE